MAALTLATIAACLLVTATSIALLLRALAERQCFLWQLPHLAQVGIAQALVVLVGTQEAGRRDHPLQGRPCYSRRGRLGQQVGSPVFWQYAIAQRVRQRCSCPCYCSLCSLQNLSHCCLCCWCRLCLCFLCCLCRHRRRCSLSSRCRWRSTVVLHHGHERGWQSCYCCRGRREGPRQRPKEQDPSLARVGADEEAPKNAHNRELVRRLSGAVT